MFTMEIMGKKWGLKVRSPFKINISYLVMTGQFCPTPCFYLPKQVILLVEFKYTKRGKTQVVSTLDKEL